MVRVERRAMLFASTIRGHGPWTRVAYADHQPDVERFLPARLYASAILADSDLPWRALVFGSLTAALWACLASQNLQSMELKSGLFDDRKSISRRLFVSLDAVT